MHKVQRQHRRGQCHRREIHEAFDRDRDEIRVLAQQRESVAEGFTGSFAGCQRRRRLFRQADAAGKIEADQPAQRQPHEHDGIVEREAKPVDELGD